MYVYLRMQEMILILDFGSQYTQLIARRVRELNVYCEIHPYNNIPTIEHKIMGVIFSGSPYSVHDEDAPIPPIDQYKGNVPLLGVCYGAQFLAQQAGGKVVKSTIREYGRANISAVSSNNVLTKDINIGS
ncbi:MAG: GMP synthase (glutamine-hydrolyzing), partial [Sphingobacteriales bacterium]